MDERLKRLIARREAAAEERERLVSQRKAITDLAEEEAREELAPEEDTEFRDLTGQIKTKDTEIRSYDERITELSEEAEREQQLTAGAAAVRRAQARAQVTSEARTYEKGNGRSYLLDIARMTLNVDGNGEARTRLERHANEVATDKEYRADLNRTDGTGGYFVPPLWMMNQWIELARPGRATANLVANQALPPGTDSINIPKVATGTAAAVQTADNSAVNQTDLTDTSVSAPVRTIAGQQSVALQLMEQSPVNFDEVIFRDLVADYATKVDLQVINGTGSNGQVTGILPTPGITTVTYSDTSQAPNTLYAALANAIQQVHTGRFQPPTVIVMHPRRWGKLLSMVDSQNRPLFLPGANSPMNAMGTLSAVDSQQVVGQMQGLPIVTDPNIPTNVSTNQDVILVMRASDSILYESGLRTRVLQEVKAQNLTVVLQVYSYLAFTAARYPASVVQITGAGLATPTF